jgi:BirA family transcriptional regulator, biotin operon repressor / biotin---[acetyl-CoA-carboxylase] ligase
VDNTALLKALIAGPKTGIELAEILNMSRAAVWKRIETLRAQGLDITAVEHEGYLLPHATALLEAEKIRALLSTQQNSEINLLHIDFQTGSTQQNALAHSAPEHGMAVWLAECQTAGIGRRGKVWQSPPLSNIYCSVNRRFPCSISALSGFSLAVAVILAESLQRVCSTGKLQLKWPNDIWLDEKKCAGLLIQVRGEANGPCDVTLGFGINVQMSAQAGRGIDQAWTTLAEHSSTPLNRNALTASILTDFLHGFEQYQAHGLSAFIARWRALDGLLDQPVSLTAGTTSIHGVARGVDQEGALLVEHDHAINRYHSGEVSVRVTHG